jgi:hypothetical protein
MEVGGQLYGLVVLTPGEGSQTSYHGIVPYIQICEEAKNSFPQSFRQFRKVL